MEDINIRLLDTAQKFHSLVQKISANWGSKASTFTLSANHEKTFRSKGVPLYISCDLTKVYENF